jgi:hypothetical protein
VELEAVPIEGQVELLEEPRDGAFLRNEAEGADEVGIEAESERHFGILVRLSDLAGFSSPLQACPSRGTRSCGMAKGIKPAPKKRKKQRLSEHARLVEERARSIPPGVVHELFDTSTLAVPPPAPLRHPEPGRRLVSKPPPPPPRPSHPPEAALEELEESVELEEVEGHEESQTDGFGSHSIPPPIGMHRPASAPHGPSQRSRLLPVALGVVCVAVLAAATGWQLSRSSSVALRVAQKSTQGSLAMGSERPRVPASPPPVAEDLPLLPPGVTAAPSAPEPAEELVNAPKSTAPEQTTRSAVVSVSPDTAAVAAANPVLAPPRFAASASPGAPRATSAEIGAFDAALAEVAIKAAFGRARSCRAAGDPKGVATVTLTYAPSGRVTTALVSGAFAGTSVGSCIAAALRSARVAPFAGAHVTVKRSVTLE